MQNASTTPIVSTPFNELLQIPAWEAIDEEVLQGKLKPDIEIVRDAHEPTAQARN